MNDITWPQKKDLFGVAVSQTNYAEAEDLIMRAASQHQSALVTHLPVHGVVTAAVNSAYRVKINQFDLTTPDGQPVRWALNRFHKAGLSDRVYGPELMLRLCKRAARDGVSIFLYGSTFEVLFQLRRKLLSLCPGLVIAGCESPPFRQLTAKEDAAVVQRINESGAGLVFIGLGLPKQDHFAFDHRDKINAVQLCVGAAFDFHAGTKRMAPRFMQRAGLEWLFRLAQEPRRLAGRYVTTNSLFLALVARRLLLGR